MSCKYNTLHGSVLVFSLLSAVLRRNNFIRLHYQNCLLQIYSATLNVYYSTLRSKVHIPNNVVLCCTVLYYDVPYCTVL